MKTETLLKGQETLRHAIINLHDTMISTPKENLSIGFLRSQTELLKSYFSTFQENHLKLVCKESIEGETYFSDNHFQHVESYFTQALSFIYDAQAIIERSIGNPTQLQTQSRPTLPTHLPKINLPPFSGNGDDWETFRDLFQSIVHNDPSLKPVQKLYYLKGLVQGEAKAALDAIAITDSNYNIAWNLLLCRYNNKRLLICNHLLGLTSLPKMKEESAAGLQQILDNLTRRIDSLRTIGRPVEHWDDWFIFLTVRSMDPITRRDWENQLGDNDTIATFPDIKAFLQQRISALKATEALIPHREITSSKRSSRNDHPNYPSKLKLLATSTDQNCAACQNQHYIGHCPEWKKSNSLNRPQTAAKLKLCFNCLHSNHNYNNCPSRSRCRICEASHHTTLHDAMVRKRSNSEKAPFSAPKKKATSPASSPLASQPSDTLNPNSSASSS